MYFIVFDKDAVAHPGMLPERCLRHLQSVSSTVLARFTDRENIKKLIHLCQRYECNGVLEKVGILFAFIGVNKHFGYFVLDVEFWTFCTPIGLSPLFELYLALGHIHLIYLTQVLCTARRLMVTGLKVICSSFSYFSFKIK